MKNKIFFIINPIAGKGKGKIVESQIQQFFASKNIDFKTFLTDKVGHATELTKEIINQNPTIIVACGGDGTINEVAQALIGTDVALGIIPIGSGNGLAANLHIPKAIEKIFNVIIKAKQKKIDVGKINETYFFSNMGLGIDAEVIHQYSQKKTRNFIGYVSASTKSLFNYRPKSFKIELQNDEILEDDFYFLLCSNSNEAGYGISFTPKAQLNDGKLDLIAVKKINFIQQMMFSFFVFNKNLEKMKAAKVRQIKSIKFESNQENIVAQIDGEAVIINNKIIDVTVLSNALNVIIPD